MAYRSSQARGQIRAVPLANTTATAMPDLSCLCDLPHRAVPDPEPTERGQGSNLCPHGCQSDLFLLSHNGNTSYEILIELNFSFFLLCNIIIKTICVLPHPPGYLLKPCSMSF